MGLWNPHPEVRILPPQPWVKLFEVWALIKVVIEKISYPEDLKKFSVRELYILSSEIRELIIETVLSNGGHLASPLGAVELIIALHRVFDSPTDSIVFDVGHQAYAHKILTGRGERFRTLRRFKGLSGFPSRKESIHDAFGTGHAGTSIAAALGILEAKRKLSQKGRVIAVIGDGGLTCGMSLEGLNQDEKIKRGLIVVLNDNEMSISKNVGAIASFVNKTMISRPLLKIEHEVKELLKKNIPFKESLYLLGKGLKEGLCSTYLDIGLFFNSLGFQYIGPLDGHNLKELIWVLEHVKDINKPVLIHVRTKKGKGYLPSEDNPCKFHGVSGKAREKVSLDKPKKPTYSQILGEHLTKLAFDNKKIVTITAAMKDGCGLNMFFDTFPERAYDVGICEQHAVTFAAGLASQGLRPVVAIYSTFLQRAYDQLIHDVCLQNLPVTFVIDRAGLVGDDGATHHGAFDLSYLRAIPNLVISAPKDASEFKKLLTISFKHDGPFAIRIPRGSAVVTTDCMSDENEGIEVGKWQFLKNGEFISLFGIGNTVNKVLKLAKYLEERYGINPTVINARFIKPFDKVCLFKMAKKTSLWVSIEDNSKIGGFGSLLAEFIVDEGINNLSLVRIGLDDVFVPHGDISDLEKSLSIDDESLERLLDRIIMGNGRPKGILNIHDGQ